MAKSPKRKSPKRKSPKRSPKQTLKKFVVLAHVNTKTIPPAPKSIRVIKHQIEETYGSEARLGKYVLNASVSASSSSDVKKWIKRMGPSRITVELEKKPMSVEKIRDLRKEFGEKD